MRAEKVAKNIAYDYFGNLITLGIGFISKTVFIYTLGQEYLGLSGLFTNVLTVLSLAELGIADAITFELYKPLAEKNNSAIYDLMRFYKKVYQIIGGVILVLGISLIPFLKFIIKFDVQVDINYKLLYVLFLANTVLSYWFYAYKATILIASQQKYLTKKIEYSLTIIQTVVQILVLYLFHDYVLFLIVGIIRSVIQNYLVSLKADSVFPILKERKKTSLPLDLRNKIFNNTYALSLYKISGVVLNATDNIVISALISTNVLGCYSLYNYLITTIKSFISTVFNSFIAAVGDINATEGTERRKSIFDVIFFLSFVLYGAVGIGIAQLSTLFVQLWAGNAYVMSNTSVLLMVSAFLITGLENATYIFRTGCGLYDIAKYRPVLSTIVNLVVSIVLAKKIGISGVFIGTIASRILTYWVVDPRIVYKHILNLPVLSYYITWFKYMGLTIMSYYLAHIINCLLPQSGWGAFILQGAICEGIFFVVVFCLFKKTKEFRYLVSIVERLLGRL